MKSSSYIFITLGILLIWVSCAVGRAKQTCDEPCVPGVSPKFVLFSFLSQKSSHVLWLIHACSFSGWKHHGPQGPRHIRSSRAAGLTLGLFHVSSIETVWILKRIGLLLSDMLHFAHFLSEVADRICNYNRHYAEHAGYWQTTSFLSDVALFQEKKEPIQFFDSNSGKLLFTAPIGRTWDEFIEESKGHGWPSFRDDEVCYSSTRFAYAWPWILRSVFFFSSFFCLLLCQVNWDVVRVLEDGETVSIDGTHLGHNLPDSGGRRYCINLVSIAGREVAE